MDISVIVPTLQAERHLPKLLVALKEQIYPPDEVVVIDSTSTDETLSQAQKAGCMTRVIPRSEFSHGGTRNLGAQMARGDILIFMTQDALPADEFFLSELTRPIREGWAAAATARQIPFPEASPLEAFARTFNYPSQDNVRSYEDITRLGVKAVFFSNTASAVKKDVFCSVGGFLDKIIVNEDMLFCTLLLREGYSVAYQSGAKVYHSHDYRTNQLFKRYFDIGVFFSQARAYLNGTKTTGEGLRFFVSLMRELIYKRAWLWVPRGFVETIVKYLAFRLGSAEQYLPKSLKKGFSGHPEFW